jgi:phytoene dehydrogenase-like protein
MGLPDRGLGQGVIGTLASPFDAGTAYVHFHHACGRMGGQPGAWGYVQGGMGMVSFLLCDAAREAGAVVSVDTPVAEVLPGEGVVLESGAKVRSRGEMGCALFHAGDSGYDGSAGHLGQVVVTYH